MKRQTGIKHLHRLVDNCGRVNLREDEPILVAAYAFGEILDPDVSELDRTRAALVLNEPASSVTWEALPPYFTFLIQQLELEKFPLRAYWRPAEWPVWNQEIIRPVCIWSHEEGTDEDALEALRSGDADRFRLPAPPPDEAAAQLAVERDAALAHLRQVVDKYGEREWRSEHKGFGIYPEDHLWNAAYGFLELDKITSRTS